MNRLIRIAASAAFLLALAAGLNAQCVLVPTTLSSAIADGNVRTMVVASATPNSTTTCPGRNFAAPSSTVVGTSAYIDRELVTITAVNGTTISIIRGQGGTYATAHPSSELVFSALPNDFYDNYKQGKCTRSSEIVLPAIDVKDGVIFDCLNSTWDQGDFLAGTQTSAKFRIETAPSGGTAYTSLNSAGTTLAATTMYCAELDIPSNKLLTGLASLNGTTVGTDKHLMALYDAGGNLLANSATAGATTSGASTYQAFAFTSTYFAVGPAQYFACLQTNGTTDTVRMVVTGTQDNLLTKGVTSQTFGTLAAFTAPTTFTTAVGPYAYAY